MHSVSLLVLLVAGMAIGLALAALGANLALDAVDRNDMIRRPPISFDAVESPEPFPTRHSTAGEPGESDHRSDILASADPPRAVTSGPPKSPLYPQNGVSLWDRIRVSSKRDRRAFLLGASIQIHAPETAATPGPRSSP